MFVSAIGGVSPYLRTPEGFTGARGRLEETGLGAGSEIGCGAGALAADAGGLDIVLAAIGTGVFGWEENIRAVIEAPAAAEPAAMRASVDFDMLINENEKRK